MYSMRSIQNDDIDLLTAWLRQDYVAKWFGEVEDWLVEIRGRNDEYDKNIDC